MKLLFGLAALATVAAAPGGPQDAVERVSLLVARGMAAERANDGRAMLAVARGLEALNARPAEREDDLAAHWRKRARALGVRDRQPPVRGRALGPAYRRGVLSAGQGLSTQQVFLAGQKAEVALVPEPGRTLTIRIAGRDQQICERTATAPKAACSWLPVFTHRVEIRISNQGAQSASYYLVSN